MSIRTENLRTLGQLDQLLAEGPHIWSSAAWGALLGGVFGYAHLARRPEGERHIAKYAAFGAVGFAAFSALAYGFGRKVSEAEHLSLGLPGPGTPVVTRGAFAGMPRPLHLAKVRDFGPDPRHPGMTADERNAAYLAWLLERWQGHDPKLVRDLQESLGVVPADGIAGPATEAAIAAVQTSTGLPVTGLVDEATMEALILG